MKNKIIYLLIAVGVIVAIVLGATAANRSRTGAGDSKQTGEMRVIELNMDTFSEKVMDVKGGSEEWNYLGDKPAIIDFYATWCGPCKAVAPVLEELAEKYEDEIVIYKVDVDKERELAQAFGVSAMPTFLFIPLDDQPQKAMGALPKTEFEKAIKSVLLKKAD